MHEIFWCLRHRQVAAPFAVDFFLIAELLDFSTRQSRRYPALARPTSSDGSSPNGSSQASWQQCYAPTRTTLGELVKSRPLVHLMRHGTKGRLGQLRLYHGSCTLFHNEHNRLDTKDVPKQLPADESLREIHYWERRLLKAKAKDGTVGVQKLFNLFKQKRFSQLLVHPGADGLRDGFLVSLQDDDIQLAKLVSIARELRTKKQFIWPNLYEKIIYSFLSRSIYDKALAWHWNLAPDLLPTSDMLGGLLAEFAASDDPEMQDALEKLYILQLEHKLYDFMIPTLYRAGRSKQARSWRHRLLNHQDLPVTQMSQPFLCFLRRYYPQVQLTEEELRIAEGGAEVSQQQLSEPETDIDASGETYSDSLVAKWLATQWMPLDFAINFVLNLGLRTFGPRSLQSLALRETNAKGLAERIAAMEKRDIKISRHVYCDALVHFARRGDDDLLSLLLHSDIHPNEFDDRKTRRLLLAASLKNRDTKQATLLRGIEAVIGRKRQPDTLAALLEKELWKGERMNPRWALERMQELNIPVRQSHAKRFLQDALQDVSWHAKGTRHSASQLNIAVDTIRAVSRHDVGIPVWCWRKVLTALGRAGRLDELERLSLEIVDLFQPHYGGLIPIYHDDLPRVLEPPSQRAGEVLSPAPDNWRIDTTDLDYASDSGPLETPNLDGESYMRQDSFSSQYVGDDDHHQYHNLPIEEEQDLVETEEEESSPEYIPADLPFYHQEHPLYKIFDASLQRSIIRWGFDRMLAQRPQAFEPQGSADDNLATYDLARGVRLLALLRDQGVVVHTDLVRSAVMIRIALNQGPGRRRSHARDGHEMSAETLKPLFDEAWGAELLPESNALRDKVERQKLQIWKRYPRLFGRAMDDEYDDTKQAMESWPMG